MRMGHHCRLATNWQCCRNHHCRLETNRQCWPRWHCRLEPQTGNVSLFIIVGSCHKPVVLVMTTLPVKTQPTMLVKLNSAGWSNELAVLVNLNSAGCVKNRQ